MCTVQAQSAGQREHTTQHIVNTFHFLHRFPLLTVYNPQHFQGSWRHSSMVKPLPCMLSALGLVPNTEQKTKQNPIKLPKIFGRSNCMSHTAKAHT